MKTSKILNLIPEGIKMILFASLMLIIVSCGDDDDAAPVPTQNIVEVAQSSDDLTLLTQALTKYPDLVNTLSSDGNFTVFAPSDAAFQELLLVIGQSSLDDIPEDVLRRVLEYHVVAGTAVASADLSDGQNIATVLNEDVTVSVGDQININNATVVTADVNATNGFVHIIDAVLTPDLEASIVNTIVEAAYFSKDFTILTDAVVKAGLLNTLIDRSADFTLFAPTNDAFEAAGITSLDGLSAQDLTPILQYHVLGSEIFASQLPPTGSAVTTLNGDFYLSINNNGVFINGNPEVVVATNSGEALDYTNGVVHVIDLTLMPPTQTIVEIAVAASQASSDAEFTQLVAALQAVENDGSTSSLITVLSSPDGTNGAPFTVFAPTDAAFESLYTLAGVSDLNGLVNQIGIANVEAVLLYHVIGGSRVFSADLPNLSSNMVTTLQGSDITLNLSSLTITDTDAAFSLGSADATIIRTDILGTNGLIHVIDEVLLP